MKPTVIALGFFDGVHRGHGALLRRTVEVARQLDATPAAFTFDRPPKEVVTGKPVPLINSTQERQELMERLYGIQQVIVAPFDHEMMTMPWEDFITELLVKRYGAVHLVAGHDYHFGHKNAGDPALLQQKCRELGLGCDIIPKVEYDGITVSSTYIRTLIESGQRAGAGCRFPGPPPLSQPDGEPRLPVRPHHRHPHHQLHGARPCAGAGKGRVRHPRVPAQWQQLRRCHQRRHPPHRQRQCRRVHRDIFAGL